MSLPDSSLRWSCRPDTGRQRPLGDEATLVSCVVAPGFDFADFELA